MRVTQGLSCVPPPAIQACTCVQLEIHCAARSLDAYPMHFSTRGQICLSAYRAAGLPYAHTGVCVCTGLAIPGGFRTKYVCKYVQSRLTVGRWLANMYGKYPIIMVRMSSLSPFCRLDFPSTLRRRMYRGPPPFDGSWLLIGRARRFKVGNSFPLWKVVYNFWCIPEVNW